MQLDTVNILGLTRTLQVPLPAAGVAGANLPRLEGVTTEKGEGMLMNPFSTFLFKGKWYYVDIKGDTLRPDLLEQFIGSMPSVEEGRKDEG